MSNQENKAAKNQHYVPQFYLKYFADNDKLYVFDKINKKSFLTNVRNIASENYFYDLPLELISDDMKDEFSAVDKQELEKVMASIEYYCKNNFDSLITSFVLGNPKRLYDMDILTDDLRSEMAFFMATQVLRTKEFREFIVEFHEKFNKVLIDRIGPKKIESYSPEAFRLKVKKEIEPVLHAQFLADNKTIDEIALILAKHIWIIGVNNTGMSFYTSDNPIVRRGHKKDKFMSYNGLASQGVEICYPINSQLILILYERTYFEKASSSENRFVRLNTQAVQYYNSLQVIQSYRQLYCREDDFSLVKSIGAKNPKIYSKDKNRIKT
jgi:hypothetical protein